MIRASTTTAAVALLAAAVAPAPSAAQDPAAAEAAPVGRAEFLTSCAPCHGKAGKGDGPVARYLGDTFPDLTGLAARNDGRFPVVEVFRTIEGTPDLEAHGERLMPVWGTRYMVEGLMEDVPLTLDTRRQIVAGRIVELVTYLQSIQDPPGQEPPLLSR
ncbi:c-type cytochrome [Caenispirillum bisanense]|uniref:Cytochrome c domain-containing protein n=1 Tax=Caenispirillum bisanense TaxID=414052 RepID=A0A286G3I3_9PROT|nr:c-type cytochrome [Caenispirillum bisanense]SOD89699.1 hypothetical protein SAMN05421508_101306 [Caenispirillum bisanense]